MAYSFSLPKFHMTGFYSRISILCLLLFPSVSFALTPIARTDVVPYQRIEYGTTFKFGVVAFSKAGIKRVDFAISGQGYSGGTKSTSTMRLNTRLAHTSSGEVAGHTGWPGVWEYYVEIASNEFSSNGPITVTPKVYGDDGGSLTLPVVKMIVEATSAYSHTEAWVDSVNGNDGTGAVGDSGSPYKTLGAAMAAAQNANGGSSSGNIIYLEEGKYNIPSSSTVAVSTSGEWLTIRNAAGAARDNTIIDNDGSSIGSGDLVKVEGVTLVSSAQFDWVINAKNGANKGAIVWIHGCKLTNTDGRYDSAGENDPGAYPVAGSTYLTNSYAYNVDRASSGESIIRNYTVYKIAEDAGRNSNGLRVNVRIDDQDNGGVKGCWHADTHQNFLRAMNNEIYYNYYVTNAHYQGFFLRSNGTSSRVALVNVFVEMREPGNYGAWGGSSCNSNKVLASGSMYVEEANWDHILFWHCAFPYKAFNFWGLDNDSYSYSVTNSSFIGNIFWEFKANSSTGGEPPSLANGNSENNEALYNHYKCARSVLSGNCGYNTKAPDTSYGRTTYSHGGASYPEVLDLTDTINYSSFGYPLDETNVIDRLPSGLIGVPADLFGNQRDSAPDVGAIEGNSQGQSIIIGPTNLRIEEH